jgi:hypothetical protein
MGCLGSQTNGCGPDVGQVPLQVKPETLGEHLDRRIAAARKNVEDLCITKAKLEALNVLDHPLDLYQNIVF